MILGSALRLRATRASEEDRLRMYSEALQAFDTALAVCCERRQARLLSAVGSNGFAAHQALCGSSDGVQLVVDGVKVPLGEGILEYVGPLVEPGLQEKPLSIAMREIHADLLEHTEGE